MNFKFAKFQSLALLALVASAACSNNSHKAAPPKNNGEPNFQPQQPVIVPEGQPIGDLGPTVLLISIDGLRNDYVNAEDTPALYQLAQSGAWAKDGMKPSFPSLTFPNHYTLVTGLYPEHHGIIANDIRDVNIEGRFAISKPEAVRDPRWWLGEPIWNTAQKQGLKSGTMFWPGSEAAIGGMLPSYTIPYDGSMPQESRVAQILKWLDLPRSERPNFMTLYFEEVDTVGHRAGPLTAETRKAAAHVDQAIALLVKGLEDRKIFDQIQVIIVSDHGMSAIQADKTVFLGDVVKEFGTIESIGGGALAGLFVKDETVKTNLVRRLREYTTLVDVYTSQDMPARLHYTQSPRIPDIVISAKDNAYILREANGQGKGGTHGYDNDLLSMRATFIAHGPAFKAGTMLPTFDNVNVYNTMCALLGIQPANNDGKSLIDMGSHRLRKNTRRGTR